MCFALSNSTVRVPTTLVSLLHATSATVPCGLRIQKPAQANRQKPAASPHQGQTPNSQIKPAQAPRVPATPHPPSTPPPALLQYPPSHNQQRPTANGGPESEKMSGGGGSRTPQLNHPRAGIEAWSVNCNRGLRRASLCHLVPVCSAWFQLVRHELRHAASVQYA